MWWVNLLCSYLFVCLFLPCQRSTYSVANPALSTDSSCSSGPSLSLLLVSTSKLRKSMKCMPSIPKTTEEEGLLWLTDDLGKPCIAGPAWGSVVQCRSCKTLAGICQTMCCKNFFCCSFHSIIIKSRSRTSYHLFQYADLFYYICFFWVC